MFEIQKTDASEQQVVLGLLDLGLKYARDAEKTDEGLKMLENGLSLLGDDVPFNYSYDIGLLLINIKDDEGNKIPKWLELGVSLLKKAASNSAGLENLASSIGPQAVTMLNVVLDAAEGELSALNKISELSDKAAEAEAVRQTEVQPPAAQVPQTNKFCTKCGAKAESGSSFCVNCGTSVQAGQAPAAPAYQAVAKPAQDFYFYVILALCAAQIIVFFMDWVRVGAGHMAESLSIINFTQNNWEAARELAQIQGMPPAFATFLLNTSFSLFHYIGPILSVFAIYKLVVAKSHAMDKYELAEGYSIAQGVGIISAYSGIYLIHIMSIADDAAGDILGAMGMRGMAISFDVRIPVYATIVLGLACAVAAMVAKKETLSLSASGWGLNYAGGFLYGTLAVAQLLGMFGASLFNAAPALRDVSEPMGFSGFLMIIVNLAYSIWALRVAAAFISGYANPVNSYILKSVALKNIFISGGVLIVSLIFMDADLMAELGLSMSGVRWYTIFYMVLYAAICYVGASLSAREPKREYDAGVVPEKKDYSKVTPVQNSGGATTSAWLCRKCGKTNHSLRVFCNDCGEYR